MSRIGLLTVFLLTAPGCAATLTGTSTEIYWDRDACFADLKRAACVAGANTVYGLGESVAGRLTYLTATFSRRPTN